MIRKRKPRYIPLVGDEIYFMLFNVPENCFYGGMHTGKITQKNEDGTFKVHVQSGYTYSSIKRKEIMGRITYEQ